jgi:cytochrome c-type biogenesis protein CcmH
MMMKRVFALQSLFCLALLCLIVLPNVAVAVEPSEMLKDPKLEARARELSTQLRCMVCQNESIDESQATLAHDLRVLIRQRIAAGESNQQVRDYLVSRYGDFILLKPPFKPETLLLWGTPLLILLGGGAAILLSIRRRTSSPRPASLSAAEQEKLAALMGKDEG